MSMGIHFVRLQQNPNSQFKFIRTLSICDLLFKDFQSFQDSLSQLYNQNPETDVQSTFNNYNHER